MKTTHQKPAKSKDNSSETKKKEPVQKRSAAEDELEQEQQQSPNDSSYSEHLDVIPATPHEFPTFGIAETDFAPSDHGRTTGRMIDHEPGI
jgi:hypothetical protein